MRSFFKIFFASFLAIVIFSILMLFIGIGFLTSLATKDKPEIEKSSVLVIDLGNHFFEFRRETPLAVFSEEGDLPGLYDVVRLIREAKTDNNIGGIYVIANGNANGFAASNEIRNALMDFKTSKKFTIAYGDMMSQPAYYVASACDRIYANPTGGFDWSGFAVTLPFLKGTLEKLEIQPQIFYAGKFKSATEIFRTEEMTPENEAKNILKKLRIAANF